MGLPKKFDGFSGRCYGETQMNFNNNDKLVNKPVFIFSRRWNLSFLLRKSLKGYNRKCFWLHNTALSKMPFIKELGVCQKGWL